MNSSFKKALILMTLLISCPSAFAYDFKVGDLCYDLLSETTCAITNGKCSGYSTIPCEVTYNRKTYTVTDIKARAFSDCSDLISITIAGTITNIGNYAFYGCSGLTAISISNSVTAIKNSTFCGCSSLTNVTLPNSVTYIGDNAFKDCSSLARITLPKSVTTIGYCAFSGCSSLTVITIPNFVSTIRNSTFCQSTNLTIVNIGNGVKSIGKYAFFYCTSMTKFIVNVQVPPTCDNEALDGINKEMCTLYVPTAGMNAYKVADQWKEFFHYTSIETGIGSMKSDNATETERYNLDGTRLTTLQKGINIVRMSDGTTRKVRVR